MPRPEEITEKLKQVSQLCKEILDWASADNLSYRMIRDDVAHLVSTKEQVLNEIKQLEKRKEDTVTETLAEKERIQKEADELIKIARENLAIASRDREQARQDKEKAKQELYLAQKTRDRELGLSTPATAPETSKAG